MNIFFGRKLFVCCISFLNCITFIQITAHCNTLQHIALHVQLWLIIDYSPLGLCCPVSLKTYSRNALALDKIYRFSCRISSCALSRHQFDLFGNSPTAPRFDRALVPTENRKKKPIAIEYSMFRKWILCNLKRVLLQNWTFVSVHFFFLNNFFLKLKRFMNWFEILKFQHVNF